MLGCREATQVNVLQGIPASVPATITERGQTLEVAAIGSHGMRAHTFLEREVRQEIIDAFALAPLHAWSLSEPSRA
jgi:hypothetical protein